MQLQVCDCDTATLKCSKRDSVAGRVWPKRRIDLCGSENGLFKREGGVPELRNIARAERRGPPELDRLPPFGAGENQERRRPDEEAAGL